MHLHILSVTQFTSVKGAFNNFNASTLTHHIFTLSPAVSNTRCVLDVGLPMAIITRPAKVLSPLAVEAITSCPCTCTIWTGLSTDHQLPTLSFFSCNCLAGQPLSHLFPPTRYHAKLCNRPPGHWRVWPCLPVKTMLSFRGWVSDFRYASLVTLSN